MADDLQKTIRARAKKWATNVTKLAHRNLGKFRKLITVRSKVEEQGGRIGVSSTASGVTARAYEYGSGIHSRLSRKSRKQIAPKGKIIIKPTGGRKFLAFHWEVANANPDRFMFDQDGRVLLPQVQHPGVKAANQGKGYLAPAINEVRKQVRQDLSKDVRDSVVGAFRKGFKK